MRNVRRLGGKWQIVTICLLFLISTGGEMDARQRRGAQKWTGTLPELFQKADAVTLVSIQGGERYTFHTGDGNEVYQAEVSTALKGVKAFETIHFSSNFGHYALAETYLLFLGRSGKNLAEIDARAAFGLPPSRFPADAPLYQVLIREPISVLRRYPGSPLQGQNPIVIVPADVTIPGELNANPLHDIDRQGAVWIPERVLMDYLIGLANQEIETVAAPCRAADLSLTLVFGMEGGRGGSQGGLLHLTNTGTAPCVVKGYPGLVLRRAAGREMKSEVGHQPSPTDGSKGDRAVLLAPQGAADVWLMMGYACLSNPRSRVRFEVRLNGGVVSAYAAEVDFMLPRCDRPGSPLFISLGPLVSHTEGSHP